MCIVVCCVTRVKDYTLKSCCCLACFGGNLSAISHRYMLSYQTASGQSPPWLTSGPVVGKQLKSILIIPCARLPNARMLNIWFNIKNNCSMKKIQNRGMSFNSLWIPAFVV